MSEANGGEPFDTLSDALSYANNVLLDSQKKGGMAIKYVQSSDNRYVQYRLMNTAWSTTESDWQGVDDEPTDGSDNLVKSHGVFSSLYKEQALSYTSKKNGTVINIDGTIDSTGSGYVATYDITDFNTLFISGRVSTHSTRCLYAFYGENDLFISYGIAGGTETAGTYTDLQVNVPQGALTIKVQGHDINGPAAVKVPRSIKELLNEGYIYKGIVTPDTVPDVSKGKVFYIATKQGSYQNFDSISVPAGINILKRENNQWVLEQVYGVDNDIKEDNTGLAKSSEVYKFIHQVLDGEEETKINLQYTSKQTGIYIGKDGEMGSGGSAYVVATYGLAEYRNIFISGRMGSVSGRLLYAFYDVNDIFIPYDYIESSSETAGTYTDLSVTVPQGATTVKVQGNDSNRPAVKVTVKIKDTIYPTLVYETIDISTGNFSEVYNGKKYLSTPRFIKIPNSIITFKSKNNVTITVFKYGYDFSYVGYSEYELEANSPLELLCDAYYIKVMLSNTSTEDDISNQRIELSCKRFDVDWDTFNPISSDNGYHRIVANVNITNPNCCDTITGNLQDSENVYPDYGVIALPTQYSIKNKPTRLIIYCHGAAVNYDTDVIRFNSTDLEPEYWLNEGYAVMDVEGNPFNNTDEHVCTPQAMDCYIAAYEWIIEHYNIRRDGVFLGGRSMGGLNTLNLISPECPIPVIAACPNVPVVTPIWFWGYMNSARRNFAALHMGFSGTTPTWTSSVPLSENEWQYLKDNFVKLARYSPLWRLISNSIIDKSVFMDDDFNSSTASTRLAKTRTVYNNLAIKVKCPVKIFGTTNDSTCIPAYNSVILQKMLENGANISETRWFESSLHHYDTQEPALRTTVTTRFGVEMTNVPIVYVEMLQFWRRYEQGN